MGSYRRDSPKLGICRRCGEKSLFYNDHARKWECLNLRCSSKNNSYNANRANFGISRWLVNLLESRHLWPFLICLGILLWAYLSTRFTNDNPISLAIGIALPIVALAAIKYLLKYFIPQYHQFAASHYLSSGLYKMAHSGLTRLMLILSILGLLIWIIYTGYILISFKTLHAISTAIILIMQVVFFFWAINVYRNSRILARRPRFTPVFWTVILVGVILSFLNIYPFSIPKYAINSYISQVELGYKKMADESIAIATTKPTAEKPAIVTGDIESKPSTVTNNPTSIVPSTANKTSAPNTSRVWINGNTYLAGGDGSPIIIVNNPEAIDPTWNQLVNFIKSDETDKHTYQFGSFVCADFAEMLHNNAEKAGIKAAYVGLELGSSPDYPTGAGHACNAFRTSDRGLVYIDCTRHLGAGPRNADKTVEVRVGSDYRPKALFSESGWLPYTDSMGEVLKVEVIQW